MRLASTETIRSPDDPTSRRVIARLQLESRPSELTFWFDIPAIYQGEFSQIGNPWVTLMVPIAMEFGEDISLSIPVDPLLVENLRGIMAVWHDWFPELRPAKIEAPAALPAAASGPRRGMFFSGGSDAFFTLLRHDTEAVGGGGGPVDTLIFIEGFDIPLSASQEILAGRKRLAAAAASFGKRFLPISTNLKELNSPYKTRWSLSHACGMAAIVHLLNPEFGEILIGSSFEYGLLVPFGSHPMTDPLLSSRSLRIVHDGATYARHEKIAHVCTSDRALETLRVCYVAQRHDNCSRCPKCLLTMCMIDASGAAQRARSFDWSLYSMDVVAGLLLDEYQIRRAGRIIEMARSAGREDLAAALQRAIDRSTRIEDTVEKVRALPLLWRFDYQIRKFLIRRTAAKSTS